jgi:hypothetical protein
VCIIKKKPNPWKKNKTGGSLGLQQRSDSHLLRLEKQHLKKKKGDEEDDDTHQV